MLLCFHLYDAAGRLVADSNGFDQFPKGIVVKCAKGEQLLNVPLDPARPVQYRLYNASGHLLTWSDGVKTKIYPQLRMDGVGHRWTAPAR